MSDDVELDDDSVSLHAVPAVVADDTGWRRLHPLSLLVNLIPQAWGVVRQVWPFVLIALFGRGGRGGGDRALFDLAFNLLLIVGLFGLALLRTVVHFLTLRYRLADGQLELRSGLLVRNRRVISPDKVQNVELVRNVFHRATGLVEVRIETASGTEIEGLLSALTEQDAQRLVTALTAARRRAPATPSAAPPVLVANSLTDLFVYGATSTGFSTTVVGLWLLLDYTGVATSERVERLGAAAPVVGVLLVLAAILGGWLIGVVGVVVQHHAFALRQDDDALVAEEGLLTRRRVELPIRKVQLVSVREPVLRRLAGIASVVIETAAARAGRGGTQRALSMVPVTRDDTLPVVLAHALPHADVDLDHTPLHPPARSALRRAIVRAVLQATLVVAVSSFWWPWNLVLCALYVLLPALAWLDWRHQGWLITDHVIVSRRGWLSRVTHVVARDKLQSIDVAQGPLLARYGLGEVLLRVAGSRVPMPLLDHDQATALAAWLSQAVARPQPAGP